MRPAIKPSVVAAALDVGVVVAAHGIGTRAGLADRLQCRRQNDLETLSVGEGNSNFGPPIGPPTPRGGRYLGGIT